MDKYSYYPIHLNTGVGITGATITFYNEEIEKAEKIINQHRQKHSHSII